MVTEHETLSIRGRTALVIGASSGVGRATVRSLISEGARVAAVARGRKGLEMLRAQVPEPVQIFEADASQPRTAPYLLRQLRPDLVVLTAGAPPHMAPLEAQTWETFSKNWNVDTQAAFYLVQAALALPLSRGSVVVIVSSGAAIDGSPLSGGYAGAKRMQWLLAEYAQVVSERKKLGIRFVAVLPRQLIEGTEIGNAAAAAYGAMRNLSGPDFMRQNWASPLDIGKVATAIVEALRGNVAQDVHAIKVTGEGVEPLK